MRFLRAPTKGNPLIPRKTFITKPRAFFQEIKGGCFLKNNSKNTVSDYYSNN